MNRELFLSVLALDSYNRGSDAGTKIILETLSLGLSSIIPVDNDKQDGWRDAGFYAVSYDWQGDTVISYRGTDFDPSSSVIDFFSSPLFNDVWRGWSLAAGFSGNAQGQLAIKFYEAVTGTDLYALSTDSPSVILTGHSLGGGLAGFVGSLAERPSYLYDHMPFGVAAWVEAIADAFAATSDRLDIAAADAEELFSLSPLPDDLIDGIVKVSLFIDTFVEELSRTGPNFDLAISTNVLGEVLAGVRSGDIQIKVADVAGNVATVIGLPALGRLLDTAITALGLATVELEQQLPLNSLLTVYDATFTPVEKHSMALLTTLTYASTDWLLKRGSLGSSDWLPAAKFVLPAMFDANVAQTIGLQKRVTGVADAGSQLASVIAYSAIDEGERPFGDTGIRALFNDASELGKALGAAVAVEQLASRAPIIAQTIVHYAGELALNDVEADQQPRAPDGVLSLIGEGRVLAIDFTEATWKAASGGSAPSEIAGKDELLIELLTDETRALMQAHWGSTADAQIARVAMSISEDGATVTLVDPGAGKVTLFAGSEGNDTVTGSTGNDLLIGGNGSNNMQGGDGSDILLGGTGTDILAGGKGDDYLADSGGSDTLTGGEGDDTYAIVTGTGDVTIDDDKGTLLLDGIKVGSTVDGAEGSIASGTATRDENEDIWQLGGYRITKSGNDLKLDSGDEHIMLKSYQQDDYGIHLGPRQTFKIDQILYESPDTLNVYQISTIINNRVTYQYVNAYATDPIPAGGVLYSYVYSGSNIIVRPENIAGGSLNEQVKTSGYAAGLPIEISTGSGRDVIDAASDYINPQNVYAGDGSDVITTRGGAGQVFADAGDDSLIFWRVPAVNGNPRPSPLTELYGGVGRDSFAGVAAALIDGGSGIDAWSFSTPQAGDATLDIESGQFSVAGTEIRGRFTSIERFSVQTYNGNDFIVTGDGADTIGTGTGVNVVYSGEGADTISSVGLDTIYAGDGNDSIIAYGRISESNNARNSNNVVFYGEKGDDYLWGGLGNDAIYGGEGADFLIGDKGNDTIVGGSGNDTLNAGAGINRIEGGTGNDVVQVVYDLHYDQLIFKIGDGQDIVQPGAADGSTSQIEIDGIILTGSAWSVGLRHWQLTIGDQVFDLTRATIPTQFGPAITGDLVITRADAPGDSITIGSFFYRSDADMKAIFGFELAAASPVNRTPTGAATHVFSGAMEDIAFTVSAAALLEGFTDPDGDRLNVGGLRSDNVIINDNADGTYTLTPATNFNGRIALNYTVSDGRFGSISGRVGIDFASINDAPQLTGIPVSLPHVLQGGSLVVSEAALLQGFTDVDNDVLRVTNLAQTSLSISDNNDGTYTITPQPVFVGVIQLTYDVSDGHGGAASTSATLQVDPMQAANIVGSEANDAMVGTTSGEMLLGLGGDDRLRGFGGSDVLIGGTGNDVLDGGTGDDRMEGGDGGDTFFVDSPGDVVVEAPGGGNDAVKTTLTSYTLGANVELVQFQTTVASTGFGNELGNTLFGGSADDTLSGLAGDDRLVGGVGDDVLIGGVGRDTLEGGAGSDHFMFATGDFATLAKPDTIKDFDANSGDLIDLTGTNVSTFIGFADFSGTAGEVRAQFIRNYTLVYGDVNGDKVADFAIQLFGNPTLTADNFAL